MCDSVAHQQRSTLAAQLPSLAPTGASSEVRTWTLYFAIDMMMTEHTRLDTGGASFARSAAFFAHSLQALACHNITGIAAATL